MEPLRLFHPTHSRHRRGESSAADEHRPAPLPGFSAWRRGPCHRTPLIVADDARKILTAINALEPGVTFSWGFSEIAGVVAALLPQRQVIARACIDFFEGRIDREALGVAIG